MAKRTTGQVFDISKVYNLYDKDDNLVASFTDDPDRVRSLYNSNPTLIETGSVDTGANTNVALQRSVGIPDEHFRQVFSENQGTVSGGIVRSQLLGILAPDRKGFVYPFFGETVSGSGGSPVRKNVRFRNVPEGLVLSSIRGPGSPTASKDQDIVFASFTQTMTVSNQNKLYGVAGSPQIPDSGSVDFYIDGSLARTRTVAQLMSRPSVALSADGTRVVNNAYGFYHGGRIYWIGRSGRTIVLGATGMPGSATNFVARKDNVVAPVSLPYQVQEGDDIQFNANYPSSAGMLRRIEIVLGGETIYWTLATGPFAQRRITQEVGKESSEGYLVYLPNGKTQTNIRDYSFVADHGPDIYVEERPGGIFYSFLRTGEVGVTVDALSNDVTDDGRRTEVVCNGTPHISSDREVTKADTRLGQVILYRGAEYCEQDLRSYFDIGGGALTVGGATDVTATVTKTATEFKVRIVPNASSVNTIANNTLTLTQGTNVKELLVDVYPDKKVGGNSLYDASLIGRDLALNAGLVYFYELDRFDWTVYGDDGEDHDISDLDFSLGSSSSVTVLPDGSTETLARYSLPILSGDTHRTLRIEGVNSGNALCVLKIVDSVLTSSEFSDIRKDIVIRDIRGYVDQSVRDDVYFVTHPNWVDAPVPESKFAQENTLSDLGDIDGMPASLVYVQDGVNLEFTLDGESSVRIDERDPATTLRLKDGEYDHNSSNIFRHVATLSRDNRVFDWPLLSEGE